MVYIVLIKQGGDDVSFKFTDSIRANMFAEMAAKNIIPATYYGSGEIKPVSVSIQFEVQADEPDEAQDEPAAENNDEEAE